MLVLFYGNPGEEEAMALCALWHTPHSLNGYYWWNVKLVE